MTTALLIIDVQRALCEGPHEAFGAQALVERIDRLARQARQAGAPVVIVQHESSGPLLAYGSEGWQLARGLHTEPTDVLLRKTTPDSFHKTALEALLRERQVTRLVVCGMQSDFCVDTTTRRALALGFAVVLVSDGHSTLDNEHLSAAQIIAHHNTTLSNIESFGPVVTLVASQDVEFAR
ncbi:cysteine hydrolase family protein [Ideonella sp. A 288]|uniref:cysteine hydrolase family protein n=1 Tax=Ideonella sp. A 288 TaxID=1962181 RepID=UPI000B4AFCF9|nr:cysteine hydrolase family protein [Ideonella sp. A 288]